MNDPFRERTLSQLGVTASVTTEQGVCVIRMSIENFDRMVQEVAFLIRSAERKAQERRKAS